MSVPTGDVERGVDATRVSWDVIVIGAGPAGALAARQLSLEGLAVLLVDRKTFPRAKPCGGCLSAKGLFLLESAGLSELRARLSEDALTTLCLAGWSRQANVSLPPGAVLDRARLDSDLAREAEAAGARFLGGVRARLGLVAGERRKVTLTTSGGEEEASASLVLVADGLAGGAIPTSQSTHSQEHPESLVGFSTCLDQQSTVLAAGTVTMVLGSTGYVGLAPLPDGRINMAAALAPSPSGQAVRPTEACLALFREAGLQAPTGLEEARFLGTPRLTRGGPLPELERVFTLGDATGYVEPFTGEGMASALEDALCVVPFVVRGLAGWSGGLARDWRLSHARRVEASRRRCRAIARVLRTPWLLRLSLSLLPAVPTLGQWIAAKISSPSIDGPGPDSRRSLSEAA